MRSGRHRSFEHDGVQHSAQTLNDIVLHEGVHFLLQMPLRILFANIFDGQLLGRHFFLILERLLMTENQIKTRNIFKETHQKPHLIVVLCQFQHLGDCRLIDGAMFIVVG